MSATLRPYEDLLASKRVGFEARGFKPGRLNSALFDHQRAVTDFALRQGCAALFLDTGLGKTLCALEWGRSVVKRTNRPALMLAPLAVSFQHAREAEKFGIDARVVREPSDIAGARIYITNYERLERAIRLWSNPGDVVLSPFMGIGSEGYVALKAGRKFVGVELKDSYFRQAVKYLTEADALAGAGDLFTHAQVA